MHFLAGNNIFQVESACRLRESRMERASDNILHPERERESRLSDADIQQHGHGRRGEETV